MKVIITFYGSKSEEGEVTFRDIVRIDCDEGTLRLLQSSGEVFSGDIEHFTFMVIEDRREGWE